MNTENGNSTGASFGPRLGLRPLDRVGPYVSELCVGTSPLGGMPGTLVRA